MFGWWIMACVPSGPTPPPAVEVGAPWSTWDMPIEPAVPMAADARHLELWLAEVPGEQGPPRERLMAWLGATFEVHGLQQRPPARRSAEHRFPLTRFTDDGSWIDVSHQSNNAGESHVVTLTVQDRPASTPVGEVGAAWSLGVSPGMPRLKSDVLACVNVDDTAHVFYPDGQFERHWSERTDLLRWEQSPTGFRVVDPTGAMHVDPTPCLSPRVAHRPDGSPAAVLCAHRRWDCGLGLSAAPTVLVRDAGAGPAATAMVAALVGREMGVGGEPPVFADGRAPPTDGVVVQVSVPQDPNDRAAQQAQDLADRLITAMDRDLRVGPLELKTWRGAPAPVVVLVGGKVALRSP